MTPQEIVTEIRKLPAGGWEAIKESIEHDGPDVSTEPMMSEDEFLHALKAKGVISEIPDWSSLTDDDLDFEPIEVEGELLSDMIIRERR